MRSSHSPSNCGSPARTGRAFSARRNARVISSASMSRWISGSASRRAQRSCASRRQPQVPSGREGDEEQAEAGRPRRPPRRRPTAGARARARGRPRGPGPAPGPRGSGRRGPSPGTARRAPRAAGPPRGAGSARGGGVSRRIDGEERQLARALEGPPAREHLVEHGAEGEDVGARVHRAALGLLRRHVGGGAEDAPGGCAAGELSVGATRVGRGALGRRAWPGRSRAP